MSRSYGSLHVEDVEMPACGDDELLVRVRAAGVNPANVYLLTHGLQRARAERFRDLRVTGVCSAGNVELVRSIGADEVLDYSREDFVKRGERYDVILDCYSNRSLFAYRRVLKPDGRYVAIGGPFPSFFVLLLRIILMLFLPRFVMLRAKRSTGDLATLGELMAAGKLTPVIEQRYGLGDVAKAYAHVAAGHTRGKVVIIPT